VVQDGPGFKRFLISPWQHRCEFILFSGDRKRGVIDSLQLENGQESICRAFTGVSLKTFEV